MTEQRQDRPGAIHARPVPHPWRWVALVVIAILVAMMISSWVTNPRWDFAFALKVMNYKPVLSGLVQGTILTTIFSMILGVVGGVLIAIMRLSKNPVLRGVSFVYTWFFRAIPRYVLLAVLGTGVLFLYPTLDFGIPFGQQIAKAFGFGDPTFYTLDVRTISNGIIVGIIGLGLSEAAYMAEIARAGILSVDKGQTEAAQALGMSRGLLLRRVVLPQAMRVIIPPTGNEFINMLKTSSLAFAITYPELTLSARDIYTNNLRIFELLFVAAAWYLLMTTIFTIGQYYLERRFARGSSHDLPPTPLQRLRRAVTR